MMQTEKAAACLESLGNPTRLDVFRQLVRAGQTGMAVGQLQKALNIPGSTLSHHLKHLVQHNLVHQERQGRVLRCFANYQTMGLLMAFLTEECCSADAC